MEKLITLLFVAAGITANSGNVDLKTVRTNFSKAAENKDLCNNMIGILKLETRSNLCLAYLGGYQAIWANHVFNPFSKLKTFNEGRKNIEQAVKNEPANPEIRLVRLSVQKNAPAFLDYSSHEKSDESFIRNHLNSISDPLVLRMAMEQLK